MEKILAHGANQTVAGHNISVERFEKIAKPQENVQSTVPWRKFAWMFLSDRIWLLLEITRCIWFETCQAWRWRFHFRLRLAIQPQLMAVPQPQVQDRQTLHGVDIHCWWVLSEVEMLLVGTVQDTPKPLITDFWVNEAVRLTCSFFFVVDNWYNFLQDLDLEAGRIFCCRWIQCRIKRGLETLVFFHHRPIDPWWGDSNGSDKSSAAGANGMGESGSGGSEEGSDKGPGNPDFRTIHQRVEGWGGLLCGDLVLKGPLGCVWYFFVSNCETFDTFRLSDILEGVGLVLLQSWLSLFFWREKILWYFVLIADVVDMFNHGALTFGPRQRLLKWRFSTEGRGAWGILIYSHTIDLWPLPKSLQWFEAAKLPHKSWLDLCFFLRMLAVAREALKTQMVEMVEMVIGSLNPAIGQRHLNKS